ncbi:DUF262 domain-containing protein [Vreelandella alkaliphila]|uniref:DUF262 domain-containing protein n=1 Tax=Vreelandella alkaliphila TaxID=272774 RepID=UPI003FD73E4E
MLEQEVKKAKQEIVKDGIDMSVGEIMRIYERGELIIHPEYQRLFRWDDGKKTRFIESLMLGIPVPPIFVFTDEEGRWELIDGLQRLSTIFQYTGILKSPITQEIEGRFIPKGTKLLPSLEGMMWEINEEHEDVEKELPLPIRLDVERSRIRVEILKRESDNTAKYELFQRLNTGGAKLSEQEVRNCVLVMLNQGLYNKLETMNRNLDFERTTVLTDKAKSEQKPIELVFRFLSYRYQQYNPSIDVHDWLDDIAVAMANDTSYDIDKEEEIFNRTFSLINKCCGEDAFKKFDNGSFSRGFLISAYEAITHGVSKNIDFLEAQGPEYLRNKIELMWSNDDFTLNARAGVRGTTRLGNILPVADKWFR